MKKAVKGLFKIKGSPNWFIRYSDRNGRIRRQSTNTIEKKLAKDILDKKRVQVAEGRHLNIKRVVNISFYDLCTQFWDTRGKHLRMKGLDSMIEKWKLGLGNVMVREMTSAKIEKFLNDRMSEATASQEEAAAAAKEAQKEKKGEKVTRLRFGPAGRNRHLSMLKALFNWGVKENMVETNPTAGIKKMVESAGRTRFLEQEEIDSLLSSASDTFKPLLVTALNTGMRRGEIFNLKWPDVDLMNRVLIVRESKAGKPRTIPINETLAATLGDLPSRFAKGYVFPSPKIEGEPMQDINHTFRRVTKKAKLDDVRFHDLRHTFASQLVIGRASLKAVQELLGHSSLTMTMRYSHLADSHKEQTVKLLDKLFPSFTVQKTDQVASAASGQSL